MGYKFNDVYSDVCSRGRVEVVSSFIEFEVLSVEGKRTKWNITTHGVRERNLSLVRYKVVKHV